MIIINNKHNFKTIYDMMCTYILMYRNLNKLNIFNFFHKFKAYINIFCFNKILYIWSILFFNNKQYLNKIVDSRIILIQPKKNATVY